jgi:RNA polymerase sigma-70 factor (ECF subfamily)
MLFHIYEPTQGKALISEAGQARVAALVASHDAQLRRYLLSHVRNSADVPDLVQEVYLRMLRIPDYEAIRSPEAYLFTVAHHVAHQHAMQRSNSALPLELQEMLSELAEVPNDPALEVSAQQSLEEMERALGQLSPRSRATFLYHRRDGLTLQDIANRYGVSRQMVKKYLANAILEFRKRLSDAE